MTPLLDVLPQAQRELWPQLRELPPHFVLYGGTAIALRLGHRVSVDFDFFTDKALGGAGKQELLGTVSWLADADILQTDRDTLTVSLKRNAPIKISFFGAIKNGCVSAPSRTNDDVTCIASMEDLFAHKLKVIHDRAEGKDYQDIACMLMQGQNLAQGLAAKEALFGTAVPPMVTLKALAYVDDISEPWRLSDDMKTAISNAIKQLPDRWEPASIVSQTISCTPSTLP
jgi:hypothetical protein